jgi:hypothetical protein
MTVRWALVDQNQGTSGTLRMGWRISGSKRKKKLKPLIVAIFVTRVTMATDRKVVVLNGRVLGFVFGVAQLYELKEVRRGSRRKLYRKFRQV